jgi:glycosidase
MHVAFTLSVRGIPQLYYGEEIAMEGKDDPDNRRDFPGGFPGDPRNAFQPNGRTRDQERMWNWTQDWIRLRRDHSALRDGKLIDLYYDDDVYVFARKNKSELVIVAFNSSGNEKKVNIPTGSLGLKDGMDLSALIGTATRARLVNGNSELTLSKHSASAFLMR